MPVVEHAQVRVARRYGNRRPEVDVCTVRVVPTARAPARSHEKLEPSPNGLLFNLRDVAAGVGRRGPASVCGPPLFAD